MAGKINKAQQAANTIESVCSYLNWICGDDEAFRIALKSLESFWSEQNFALVSMSDAWTYASKWKAITQLMSKRNVELILAALENA